MRAKFFLESHHKIQSSYKILFYNRNNFAFVFACYLYVKKVLPVLLAQLREAKFEAGRRKMLRKLEDYLQTLKALRSIIVWHGWAHFK